MTSKPLRPVVGEMLTWRRSWMSMPRLAEVLEVGVLAVHPRHNSQSLVSVDSSAAKYPLLTGARKYRCVRIRQGDKEHLVRPIDLKRPDYAAFQQQCHNCGNQAYGLALMDGSANVSCGWCGDGFVEDQEFWPPMSPEEQRRLFDHHPQVQ